MAAAKGEEDKDAHHDELVQVAGGVFVPLVVESLGLWSAASRPVLQDIDLRTTTMQEWHFSWPSIPPSARATLCLSVMPQCPDIFTSI